MIMLWEYFHKFYINFFIPFYLFYIPYKLLSNNYFIEIFYYQVNFILNFLFSFIYFVNSKHMSGRLVGNNLWIYFIF